MHDGRELPLPAARNETTIEGDLPTCPECGCVMGASERCTACKLRAEGEKAATERIARFAEHEATRLERRCDDYGTLAAVALDGFAHALRLGQHECES